MKHANPPHDSSFTWRLALGPREVASEALATGRAVGASPRGWRPDICPSGGLYSGRVHPLLRTVVAAALLLLCGCGSSPSPTPTPVPATPTPAPTPTATPGPDTEQISVLQAGVGVYLLTTIPVAVVHNDAHAHAATNVDVRFAVFNPAGKPVGGTDADIPYLAPGQTMGIGGRLDQSGSGLRATAMVIGEQWAVATSSTPPLTISGTSYAAGNCGSCSSGAGYGTATGTLSAAPGTTVGTVTITAVCYRGGAITGGGSDIKAVMALPRQVQEPVINSTPPTRCDLYASPGP